MVRQGQHPTDEPASLPRGWTSGQGRGSHALAGMAGALTFIPTACTHAIIYAHSEHTGFFILQARHLQQALKKGASRLGHLGKLPQEGTISIQLEEWEERLPGETGCGKSIEEEEEPGQKPEELIWRRWGEQMTAFN